MLGSKMQMLMSTGKVVGGFFRAFRAVIWRPCFLRLLYGDLQEGLLGVDWAGGKARSMVRSKKKAFRKEVLEVVRVGKS